MLGESENMESLSRLIGRQSSINNRRAGHSDAPYLKPLLSKTRRYCIGTMARAVGYDSAYRLKIGKIRVFQFARADTVANL